jgi:hypothetical protein
VVVGQRATVTKLGLSELLDRIVDSKHRREVGDDDQDPAVVGAEGGGVTTEMGTKWMGRGGSRR